MKNFKYRILIFVFILLVKSQGNSIHDILFTGNDSTFTEGILYLHNTYRALLLNGSVPNQPKANHMKILKWDEELAKSAQEVANLCKFEHIETNTTQFDVVGQNIFITCTNYEDKIPNWNETITYWFNENLLYKYPDEPTLENGHYTQLVWAETEFLGCGYTYYKLLNSSLPIDCQMLKSGHTHCGLYVCHYGPCGNYVGEPPYETDDMIINETNSNNLTNEY